MTRQSQIAQPELQDEMHGFAKNERANINDDELEGLQTLAADLPGRSGRQLGEAVADGTSVEIYHGRGNETES